MKILVIARGGVEIGLGHIIRSRTFIEGIHEFFPGYTVDYYIIGTPDFQKLILSSIKSFKGFCDESKLCELTGNYDYSFFDTIRLSRAVVDRVKSISGKCISLSPVFDQMEYMDYVFIRTQYFDPALLSYKDLKVNVGLQYTIVENNCYNISTEIYDNNLLRNKISIAISMGGADANNKTLKIVNTIKYLKTPAVFWIMLGEGYKHSFDELVGSIERDHEHEIILARTHSSMWEVLNRCSLLITTSGITSYEAVYAGLPTCVFYEKESQYYLVRELVEKGVSISGGLFSSENADSLRRRLDSLIQDKEKLLKMHLNTKGLVDRKAVARIFSDLLA